MACPLAICLWDSIRPDWTRPGRQILKSNTAEHKRPFLMVTVKAVVLTVLDINGGCEAGCKGQLFRVNLTNNSHSICQCVIKIREHQENSPPDTLSKKHTHTFSHLQGREHINWTNRYRIRNIWTQAEKFTKTWLLLYAVYSFCRKHKPNLNINLYLLYVHPCIRLMGVESCQLGNTDPAPIF